jgi:Inhibitor of vertebrate lysozyme (Ivy)
MLGTDGSWLSSPALLHEGRFTAVAAAERPGRGERRGCRVRVGMVALMSSVTLVALAPGAAVGTGSTPDRSGAAALHRHAGSYSADCNRNDAPRLRVSTDTLMVEQDGQRLSARRTGHAAVAGATSSPAPPRTPLADTASTLHGDAKDGSRVVFTVYADSAGSYLTVDGDPAVRAALGEALRDARFRRCDPGGALLLPPVAPAPARAASAVARPGPLPDWPTLVEDPGFKRLYLRALGPRIAERWLSGLDTPDQPPHALTIDGTAWLVFSLCGRQDCGAQHALFVYSAARQRVAGLIVRRGQSALVGEPEPALSAALERLAAQRWHAR